MQNANDWMYTLKSGGFVEEPEVEVSEWIARTVHRDIAKLPFSEFFQASPILVPMPRSGLATPGTLWVPEKIASALLAHGLGSKVVPCVVRVTAIRKSAWSGASERPSPTEQYQSMGVQGTVSDLKPKQIVMIDDIVTRGSTFLGAANRLWEVFPEAQIWAFAGMRTISNPAEFEALDNPVKGRIWYRPDKDDSLRRP